MLKYSLGEDKTSFFKTTKTLTNPKLFNSNVL